ncbi:unnamed protein product [Boreogadus saida]
MWLVVTEWGIICLCQHHISLRKLQVLGYGTRGRALWDWLMAGPASWWPQRPSALGLAYGRSSLMVAPEAERFGTGLWQVKPHAGSRDPVVWDWLIAGQASWWPQRPSGVGLA